MLDAHGQEQLCFSEEADSLEAGEVEDFCLGGLGVAGRRVPVSGGKWWHVVWTCGLVVWVKVLVPATSA